MKSLIITVAGMSSRFNRDTKNDVLKCLYHEGNARLSLLSQQVHKVYGLVDEIIIVGGYRYEDLVTFIRQELKDVNSKIKCIYNDHYHDFGSGYSLLKGIEFVSGNADEITFIEGDLFFNTESVATIINSPKDVISVNDEQSNQIRLLHCILMQNNILIIFMILHILALRFMSLSLLSIILDKCGNFEILSG